MADEHTAQAIRDLSLPPMLMTDAPPSAGDTPSAEALAATFQAAIGRLRSRVHDDALARAALALAPGNRSDAIARIAARLGGGGAAKGPAPAEPADLVAGLGPALYALAVDALEAGDIDDTLCALTLLLASDVSRADAAIGLSIAAWRAGNDDLALDLAVEALSLNPGHPRACLVAGLAQLARGQRRAAQTYLAAASRSARRKPDYRDDLREAQRSLLLLHLT